jgi:hypothetical protein
MSDTDHRLAGSAHQSTREIVNVLSVERQPLDPCLLNKARRFVLSGRAQWLERDRAIILVSKWTPGNDEWRWDEATWDKDQKAPKVFYPRENCNVDLPGDIPSDLPNHQTFTEGELPRRRQLVFHRAGRNGGTGSYLCTRGELALLIETGAVELRRKCPNCLTDVPVAKVLPNTNDIACPSCQSPLEIEGRWWLVWCPGNFKFLRRTNGKI